MKSNIKLIFYFCNLPILIVFVIMLFFSNINGHAVTGQKPQTVSTINFTSPTSSNVTSPTTTSTTDAIDIAMNSIRSDNMDKLLNQTILPFMDKRTSTITTATSNNQTQGEGEGEGEINQPILTSNLDIVTRNNDQTQSNATDNSTSTDTIIRANDPIPFTDNQTVLLQFQDSADSDIINMLHRIESMANEQAAVENATRAAAKSVQESSNRLMRDLSEIRSSIDGPAPSIFQSVTSGGVTELNNLTDRITSMQKSNIKILQDVSELKSSVKKPSSSYISPPIISGLVAAVISSTAIFLFLCTCKTGASVKFSELRFRRKYR